MDWLGLTIGEFLIAAILLAGAIFLGGMFSEAMLKRIKESNGRSTNPFDDSVVEALARPLAFLPLVAAAVAISMMPSEHAWIAGPLYQINRSLIAIAAFWLLYDLIDPVCRAMIRSDNIPGDALVAWVSRVAKLIVIFLTLAVLLEIWGIRIWPILAGFGLVGVAVALGAKDLFRDLIAGFLIVTEMRCKIGDWVVVDGLVEGTVESIGLRTTRIRLFDTAPVHVPNSILADKALTNVSGMKVRAINWTIGLQYSATEAQLKAVRDRIEKYLTTNPGFADASKYPPYVRIVELGPSSINVAVHGFTQTTDYAEWLKIKEGLALEITKIVRDAGTDFALPSQSIYVESLPGQGEAEGAKPASETAARRSSRRK